MTFRVLSPASYKVFQNFITECVGAKKTGNMSKEGKRF